MNGTPDEQRLETSLFLGEIVIGYQGWLSNIVEELCKKRGFNKLAYVATLLKYQKTF